MYTYDIQCNALGDATRRRILESLKDGPCSVTVLAAELPVSRPAVSQHLRVLREAGLVDVSQQGTRRLYRLSPGGLIQLRNYLDQLWNAVLLTLHSHQ